MRIYNYSPVDGTLLSEADARENPRQPGHYLIPAGATPLEPPVAVRGQVAVFDGKAWHLVEDHRGQIVYAKATAAALVWDLLGALPDHVTTIAPLPDRPQAWDEDKHAWVDDGQAIKAARIVELKAELVDIDAQSVRGIREHIVSNNGSAPQELRDLEVAAEMKRLELRDLESV